MSVLKPNIKLLLFIGSLANCTWAQVNSSSHDDVNIISSGISNVVWVKSNERNSLIHGNIYLLPSWENAGSILTKGGKKIEAPRLNYNILTDSFELKTPMDSTFTLNRDIVENIDLNGLMFKLYNVSNSESNFVEILLERDDILFLKKYKIRIRPGFKNPLNGDRTNDEYKIYKNYYFVLNGNLKSVNLSRKGVLRFFKEKSELIDQYKKENNLSYKKEKDVKQLFEFYLSLK